MRRLWSAQALVEASQIPAPTAAIPTSKWRPTGSPRRNAATADAVTGFTVIVAATRVGVVRESATAHR
jgi:hypothetical protein